MCVSHDTGSVEKGTSCDTGSTSMVFERRSAWREDRLPPTGAGASNSWPQVPVFFNARDIVGQRETREMH